MSVLPFTEPACPCIFALPESTFQCKNGVFSIASFIPPPKDHLCCPCWLLLKRLQSIIFAICRSGSTLLTWPYRITLPHYIVKYVLFITICALIFLLVNYLSILTIQLLLVHLCSSNFIPVPVQVHEVWS